MKTLLSALLSLFVLVPIFSQDLIVTGEGDSINCRIKKIKGDDIYFAFMYNDEIRSTLLPKSSVIYHQFDFYSETYAPAEIEKFSQDHQRFRLAVNTGYSYQTARVSSSVPADFREYVRHLKSGFHIGGDMTYFSTEHLGAGIKANLFRTSNSMYDIYVEDEFGNRTYGDMSDKLTILFVGPCFSTRMLNSTKKSSWVYKLALGYIYYQDNKMIINPYIVTGNTIGLSIDFGYEIGLTDKMSLGFQISALTGTLTSTKWDDGIKTEKIELEPEYYENLSRLDFSVGLRWVLK